MNAQWKNDKLQNESFKVILQVTNVNTGKYDIYTPE